MTRAAARRIRSPRRLLQETLESRQVLAAAPLVVTEVMYHPRITAAEESAGFDEDDFEFIEVENIGDQAASLLGSRFEGDVEFEFGPYALGSRQQAVIARNREAFEFRYGTDRLLLGEFGENLSNRGAELRLISAGGQFVLDVKYDDAWHPKTDGPGYSLTIIDPLGPPAAWRVAAGSRPSSVIDGTPGRPDPGEPEEMQTTPQQLEATVESVRTVALEWQAPADIADIAGYRVYRDGEQIGVNSLPLYVDGGAAPASSFVYQVSAVDHNGVEYGVSQPIQVEIEPLGGPVAFGDAEARGVVESEELTELSGMAASRRYPGLLWLVNDRSGSQTVYAIDSQAQLVTEVILTDMSSLDWEDLAVGPGPQAASTYVYVGDIGDNDGIRSNIVVYRFAEPVLDDSSPEEPVLLEAGDYDALVFLYPDGPRDAECLMVDPWNGDLYVISKQRSNSHVYRAAAASLVPGRDIMLEHVADVELEDPSAADISPNGLEVIIRNEQSALVYTRADGETLAAALMRPGLSVPVVGTPVEPNGEAIAYEALNRGYFTISEGLNPTLYFFPRLGPAAPGDANRDGVFDSADFVQVFQMGEYEDAIAGNSTWQEGDWDGDGDFDSADFVAAFQTGLYEVPPPASGNAVAAAVDWLFAQDHRIVRRR